MAEPVRVVYAEHKRATKANLGRQYQKMMEIRNTIVQEKDDIIHERDEEIQDWKEKYADLM